MVILSTTDHKRQPSPKSLKGKEAERKGGLLLFGDCNLRNKSDREICTLQKGQDYLLISYGRKVVIAGCLVCERVAFDKL